MDQQKATRLLRRDELRALIGRIPDSTLWRWERDGRFPKRVKVGPNLVCWVASEVEEFIASRIEQRASAEAGARGESD